MNDLYDRTAVITGGANGIGYAIGEELAQVGMQVALIDIDVEAVARAASRLNESGGRAIGLELDVTDRHGWERTADAIEKSLGEIHVLCNNAGIEAIGWTTEEIPPSVWDRQIAINLTGVFNGVHCVLPRIKKHGRGGHIVNTASMAGISARAGHPAYVASKHGVVGFSDALRIELADQGIGVSVVCPGAFATRLLETSRDIRRAVTDENLPVNQRARDAYASALDPRQCGQLVLKAIRDDDFFVVTHPSDRERGLLRFGELARAFDRAAAFSAGSD